MDNVYAFRYNNFAREEFSQSSEKHLIANDMETATARAKQFLIDDGLTEKDYGEACDFRITSVRLLVRIDWPFESQASGGYEHG